ncbi:Putative protein in type-1 retrotransposable element R1DM [Araneus ventricosus]|uniref:Reverse transcriptase domain-containing protein n=1 Tax=Araneus ventricosus TaxID=182803 RepID=A0A4Y2S5U3_ARAVE|nr:Putative protein in type-1 retrotransposable element R1DM [Araneus ventricosus]
MQSGGACPPTRRRRERCRPNDVNVGGRCLAVAWPMMFCCLGYYHRREITQPHRYCTRRRRNETADSLANAATEKSEVDFNVGIPESWIKSSLKEVAHQNWQERWQNSLEARTRKFIQFEDINEETNLLQNCVIEACNKSYRTKNQNLSPTPNWYTQDLEIEKNRLKALRRRAQRAPQDQRNARFQFHKEELKKYMRKVKTAKNSGWKSFCTIATNPYGTHYKAAFRKAIKPAELIALNNQDPSGNHLKIAQDILEKIFPHPANSNSSTYIPPCTANDCPFTKGEVATVIHHLSKGKAPGPDGIDNIIIQQIFKKFPFLLMELFNTCLKLAKFPDPLKVGNIILFHKHGKSKTEASSYRPISLLPTIGKILEKLLTQRLNFHLDKNNRLSNLQYGFREGRSTEMAITKLLDTIHKGKASGDHVLVLSIDIKGAFDNIQHSAISSYLDNSNCPANIVNIFINLLQNRKVILNTCEGPAIRDQKQGCPQGSCSGPALWNLVANEILQENWPINTSIQAFADDFVLVSHAPTRVQLESQINESIAKFSTWTSKNQLQISTEYCATHLSVLVYIFMLFLLLY